jgi:hypothetical protein
MRFHIHAIQSSAVTLQHVILAAYDFMHYNSLIYT